MSRQTTTKAQGKEERDGASVISVRIDNRLKRRLDRLAKASDRTNSWLVQDAISAYLDVQEWQVEAIGETVKGADKHPERGVSHDEARAWVESWGSKREMKRPK